MIVVGVATATAQWIVAGVPLLTLLRPLTRNRSDRGLGANAVRLRHHVR